MLLFVNCKLAFTMLITYFVCFKLFDFLELWQYSQIVNVWYKGYNFVPIYSLWVMGIGIYIVVPIFVYEVVCVGFYLLYRTVTISEHRLFMYVVPLVV